MSDPNSIDLKGVDGNYRAVKIHVNLNTSSLDDPSSTPGLPRYRLTDGRLLNKKDDNTFIIVKTGEELTLTIM